MDICVYGAGSIGGYLAARLAEAHTHRISVVARGPHLEAIRQYGLQLVCPERTRHVRFAAAEELPDRLPQQDIVFLTLKAHSQPGVAAALKALLKPDGHAVFVTNGVPWWWNHGLTAALSRPMRPMRVDPQGQLWEGLGPERALGCVVYSINEVTAPGTVVHRGNNRWVVGEPCNVLSTRLQATAEMMLQAGLKAETSTDLRHDIWKKLLRNTPFNTLCALTQLTADQFAHQPQLVALAQTLTDEVVQVARAKGWELPAARAADVVASGGAISGTSARGTPSMLQDVIAGRPMEVEAIVGQVQDFAREEDVSTPALDMVYTLLSALNRSLRRRAPFSPGAAPAS